jgi:hypothetical protein
MFADTTAEAVTDKVADFTVFILKFYFIRA